jgi:glycosyltransferase involved in cell wall biosynthesis
VRLLTLTPELPFAPGGTGGQTRQYRLLRGLVERGHSVATVAPVAVAQRDGAEVLREAGVELYASPRPESRVAESLRALSRSPGLLLRAARDPVVAWQVEVFWTRLRALADRALEEFSPDVVLVEHDWSAAWHRDLPEGLPSALTLQNLSWAYYEKRASAASGPAAAALGLESRRFANFDRRHLDEYDLLLAMSEPDRVAAASVTTTRCEVVPNGVDTSAAPGPEPDGPPLALFTGTLAYPPNAEALEWLLRDIWPRVRAAQPDARLAVVGPDPPESARRLADESVELTGWVAEMRPWFERASVVLVPMRSGGGTRLKVLDGLASGRAMVSTTMGAEGIDARDGEHLLLADGTDAFTDAVLRLLGDPALRHRLAAGGRELAETVYDWRVVTDTFERLLEEIAR